MPSKSEGDGSLARGQESGDKKVEKVSISVGFWCRDLVFVDLFHKWRVLHGNGGSYAF